MTPKTQATFEDLSQVSGKAELINGELILMPPTGDLPGDAGGNIYVSLKNHQRQGATGRAYPDNVGFKANLPHRQSFSPDAAFYTGPRAGMKFLPQSPVFAVEVRSEGDYGQPAELAIADKIRDYFAAGTLVVWDVDVLSEEVIKSYSAADPEHPKIFRRGDIADAEPAVPGWRMLVDELFA